MDVEDSEESHKSIVALKDAHDDWRISEEITTNFFWHDSEVTLIAPLTPERPASDLQAKYDALEDKHREAVEYIAELKPANLHPPFGTKTEPAWRIETDHKNLRVGEYIIDREDDGGAVLGISGRLVHFWSGTSTSEHYSPFIVFPNREAATPEAIEEAKRARDKETEE